MKKAAALLLAIFSLWLCACGKDTPPAPAESPENTAAPAAAAPAGDGIETLELYKDIQYYQQWQDDTLLCRVEFPQLMMDGEQAKKYAVSDALDSYNAALASLAQQDYERLLNSAMADIELNMENAGGYYSSSELYVPRADSLALSVLCRTETNLAGTAQLFFSSANFDSRTGRQLALRDVSGDLAQLSELIKAQLEKDYPKAEFYDLDAAMEQYVQGEREYVWTMDYQGLSFYFAPYELADGAEGVFSVGLRFVDHPGLFSLYYTRQPYSYAVPVIEGRCLNYDIENDGLSELITLRSLKAKDGSGLLEIGVGGRNMSVNVSLQAYDAYVVYSGPSRSFLFINAHNAAGYGFVSVYRLERTGASLVGMLYDTALQAAGYTPECRGVPLLTKPEHLLLGTKIELMGTLTGVKDYYIGGSGMPESRDEYYRVYADTTLTAKSDFVTAGIDPVSGKGLNSAAKIPADTLMFYHRSDGFSFVDLISEDGQCCRMYVSGKGSGQTVNGVPVAEFFDGVIYK